MVEARNPTLNGNKCAFYSIFKSMLVVCLEVIGQPATKVKTISLKKLQKTYFDIRLMGSCRYVNPVMKQTAVAVIREK